jgi:hypothetical protein
VTAKIVMDDGTGPVVGTLVLPATKVNTPVTLSNLDNTGVEGWRWEVRDAPIISPTLHPLPAPTFANTAVITPDVKGHSILIRLITYKDAARTIIDATDQKVLGVRFDPPFDWLIPAAGETLEVDVIRGWATNVNEFMREVWGVINGSGITGSVSGFKVVPAGTTITIASNKLLLLEGRIRMDGHLILNGHMRLLGRRKHPIVHSVVGTDCDVPNNCIVPVDPTNGPFTIRVPSRGTPGEGITFFSVSDDPIPPVVTVDGQGARLGGDTTKQLTSPREYLRLNRRRGNSFAVL